MNRKYFLKLLTGIPFVGLAFSIKKSPKIIWTDTFDVFCKNGSFGDSYSIVGGFKDGTLKNHCCTWSNYVNWPDVLKIVVERFIIGAEDQILIILVLIQFINLLNIY